MLTSQPNASMYIGLITLSIKELADLEIAIPDLETQNNIVHLDQLKNKKLKIRKQLIELENQYINTLTYKKIK
jgi:hypothetical protein